MHSYSWTPPEGRGWSDPKPVAHDAGINSRELTIARESGDAVVVLGRDAFGKLSADHPDDRYQPRARPTAVFEMGFAMA